MKYTCEVEINQPRNKVIELFDNPDNMSKWQPGLQSFEHIEGEAGKPGAKSRLKYDMNGRKVEMIETITTRKLPDEFSGTYEAKGVFNSMVNKFFEVGPDKTRWVAETEFEFSGFMKLIGFFMKGSFPKQTQKYLDNFKRFAEST